MTKTSARRSEPRRYPLSSIERLEEERLGRIRAAYVRGEYDAAELERRIWEELLAELPHKERALPG